MGKVGVHALTHNLAIEFAKDHIRVNAIAPAVVETPVFSTFLTSDSPCCTPCVIEISDSSAMMPEVGLRSGVGAVMTTSP